MYDFPFQPSLLVGTTRIAATVPAPTPVTLAAGCSQVVVHNTSTTSDVAIVFGRTQAECTANAIFP
jgi:hypothetical protein